MRDKKTIVEKEKREQFKEMQFKKQVKKQRMQERGITLIALVVTIVILLILAGVTITTILGDDGIIAQAKKAADLFKKSGK